MGYKTSHLKHINQYAPKPPRKVRYRSNTARQTKKTACEAPPLQAEATPLFFTAVTWTPPACRSSVAKHFSHHPIMHLTLLGRRWHTFPTQVQYLNHAKPPPETRRTTLAQTQFYPPSKEGRNTNNQNMRKHVNKTPATKASSLVLRLP